MEWFSTDWFIALFSIIVIDLVLAGDNAIVIGMAARNLEKSQQKKAVMWGTIGAIGIRLLATAVVLWLLKIPGLLLGGGLVLIWIAYKLLLEHKDHGEIKAAPSLMAAIRTIVIADAAMGLDNVLAIAGASDGHFPLVVIGLIISVPIVVWGSLIILQLIDRFPWIMYFGAAVLAYTASKMIVGERFIQPLFAGHEGWKYAVEVLIIALVVGTAMLVNRSRRKSRQQSQSAKQVQL